jgi:hypothetical protein
LARKVHSILRGQALRPTKNWREHTMAKKTLKKAKKLEATKPLIVFR